MFLAFSSAFSCFQQRYSSYHDKMTSDHHKNLENYLENLSIVDGCQNELKAPDFPLFVSDLNFNEATLFAAYCYIRNFIG